MVTCPKTFTVACLFLLLILPSYAAPPTTGSVVLFNTVCAQCHEMECSSRLSFSSDSAIESVNGHVQNYADTFNKTQIEELISLIEYTKTQCDYYAPEVSIPRDGVWSKSALAPLATPTRTGWFVPLGNLSAGAWVVHLNAAGEQPVELEIVTRRNIVAQETLASGHANIVFSVPGSTPHFLRLRSRAAIILNGVTVSPANGQER